MLQPLANAWGPVHPWYACYCSVELHYHLTIVLTTSPALSALPTNSCCAIWLCWQRCNSLDCCLLFRSFGAWSFCAVLCVITDIASLVTLPTLFALLCPMSCSFVSLTFLYYVVTQHNTTTSNMLLTQEFVHCSVFAHKVASIWTAVFAAMQLCQLGIPLQHNTTTSNISAVSAVVQLYRIGISVLCYNTTTSNTSSWTARPRSCSRPVAWHVKIFALWAQCANCQSWLACPLELTTWKRLMFWTKPAFIQCNSLLSTLYPKALFAIQPLSFTTLRYPPAGPARIESG